MRRSDNESPNVDRPVSPRYLWNDYMKAGSVRQHRIDERISHIETTPRPPQHAFNKHSNFSLCQDRGSELATTLACNEHTSWTVDPHFLNFWIIEVLLQWTEASDRVIDALRNFIGAQRILGCMIVHSLVDQPAHNITLMHRIDAETTNFSAYALLD
jgi:hypothetical protein